MFVVSFQKVNFHNKQVEDFLIDPKNEYNSIKYIAPEDDSPEQEARSEAMQASFRYSLRFSLDVIM